MEASVGLMHLHPCSKSELVRTSTSYTDQSSQLVRMRPAWPIRAATEGKGGGPSYVAAIAVVVIVVVIIVSSQFCDRLLLCFMSQVSLFLPFHASFSQNKSIFFFISTKYSCNLQVYPQNGVKRKIPNFV